MNKMLLIIIDHHTRSRARVKYINIILLSFKIVIRHPRCSRQGALTPHSSANDRVDRVHGARRLEVVVGLEGRRYHGDDARRRGARGVLEGVPYVRGSRARALTDQMYVLQPDNGPSRTSSGSPAALLDLVEAIVSRAFSLEPLPPHYVECPHMAT